MAEKASQAHARMRWQLAGVADFGSSPQSCPIFEATEGFHFIIGSQASPGTPWLTQVLAIHDWFAPTSGRCTWGRGDLFEACSLLHADADNDGSPRGFLIIQVEHAMQSH